MPQQAKSSQDVNYRGLVSQICNRLATRGWASGTGGGISIKSKRLTYVAPSGMLKDCLSEDQIFTIDDAGQVISGPVNIKPSECLPIFQGLYKHTKATCVIHSHSINATLASIVFGQVFEVSNLEMIKGIEGHGYRDTLVVPIIENTAHEAELTDRVIQATVAYPKSRAVLVKRHGVYFWGVGWHDTLKMAECYDYLFEISLKALQYKISL